MRTISHATDDLLYRFAEDSLVPGNSGNYTYENLPMQKRHMSKIQKELFSKGYDETHPMMGIIGYKWGKDTFAPDADRVVVARDPQGNFAGALSHHLWRADRHIGLKDMRVMPEHKGKNVGENLIQGMAAHTNGLPYGHKYEMSVSSAVPTAVKFYQKMGADFPNANSQRGTWTPEKTQQLAKGQRPEPGTIAPEHEPDYWDKHKDDPSRSLFQVDVPD